MPTYQMVPMGCRFGVTQRLDTGEVGPLSIEFVLSDPHTPQEKSVGVVLPPEVLDPLIEGLLQAKAEREKYTPETLTAARETGVEVTSNSYVPKDEKIQVIETKHSKESLDESVFTDELYEALFTDGTKILAARTAAGTAEFKDKKTGALFRRSIMRVVSGPINATFTLTDEESMKLAQALLNSVELNKVNLDQFKTGSVGKPAFHYLEPEEMEKLLPKNRFN